MGRFYQKVSGYSRKVPSYECDDDDDEDSSKIDWLGLDKDDEE